VAVGNPRIDRLRDVRLDDLIMRRHPADSVGTRPAGSAESKLAT